MPYGPLPEQYLILCAPPPDGTAKPGVLLIHGGGWIGANAEVYADTCKFFADKGFVAASVEFRAARPSARWPTQLSDVQKAFLWFREHSKSLEVDPLRICAYGGSTGGHLALWLGMVASTVQRPSQVACVVDIFGPTNLTILPESNWKLNFDALFGTGPDRQAKIRAASPIFRLNPYGPPVLIVHGTNDTLVPASQMLGLFSSELTLGLSVSVIVVQTIPGPKQPDHGYLTAAQTEALNSQIATFMRTAPPATR